MKKDSSTVERLCDEDAPPPDNLTLTCQPYDPETGILVSAVLYPIENCGEETVPDAGTYVMAVQAYYNCSVPDGQTTGVSPSACADRREVFSYDVVYNP